MATPPGTRGRTQAARERGTVELGRVRGRIARAGFVRASSGRLVGGVLAGLARRFGVSTAGVRIAFVVSILLPGPQFLLYALAWIVMPREAA